MDAATSTSAQDIVVTPTFTKSRDGYVLSAFVATFKKTGAAAPHLRFEARIDHAPVKDLTLPARLVFTATVNGVPSKTDLAFANYIVSKRQ